MSSDARSGDEIGTKIKHCTQCGQQFEINGVEDYAHVLQHWALDHGDSEIFWNVVENYRTHTRCGCCGEFFASEIKASHRGLCVDMYCRDCCEGELEDKAKSLIVDDVTGRYVLENSEEVAQESNKDDETADTTAQLFDLLDEVGR